MEHWELFFLFMIIAFVYSSVGFGGGSSYLALLAVYALPFQEMRLTALICNIIVVTGGVCIYAKKHQVNWKKILPLVVLSVPMAYIGAILKISQTTFFILLGLSLIVAAVLLWVKTTPLKTKEKKEAETKSIIKNAAIGGGIGFLSGMVGIGGGIFLSPVLHLTGWDTSKKIAATASFFILVNSISGAAGQLATLPEHMNYTRIILLCLAVLIGGQAGSRLSVSWNPVLIRRITTVLVFCAGVNILSKHLSYLF